VKEKLLKIGIVLCAFGILGIAGWTRLKKSLDEFFHRKNIHTPTLVGRQLTRVLAAVDDNAVDNLKIRVEGEIFDNTYAEGVIVSQKPAAGVPVQIDATIFVRISRGSDSRPVPELTGKNLRKARLELQKAQLRVGQTSYIKSVTVERGLIIAQYPLKNEGANKRSAVDLLVSEGNDDKLVVMPRLLGLYKEKALEILKQCGIEHTNIIERSTMDPVTDLVIEHRPLGGIQISPDSNVVVTVSAPQGSSSQIKTIKVFYQIPPGLAQKLLEIAVSDDMGRRVVFRKKLMPGEVAKAEIRGKGSISVQYFLDKILVKDETY